MLINVCKCKIVYVVMTLLVIVSVANYHLFVQLFNILEIYIEKYSLEVNITLLANCFNINRQSIVQLFCHIVNCR